MAHSSDSLYIGAKTQVFQFKRDATDGTLTPMTPASEQGTTNGFPLLLLGNGGFAFAVDKGEAYLFSVELPSPSISVSPSNSIGQITDASQSTVASDPSLSPRATTSAMLPSTLETETNSALPSDESSSSSRTTSTQPSALTSSPPLLTSPPQTSPPSSSRPSSSPPRQTAPPQSSSLATTSKAAKSSRATSTATTLATRQPQEPRSTLRPPVAPSARSLPPGTSSPGRASSPSRPPGRPDSSLGGSCVRCVGDRGGRCESSTSECNETEQEVASFDVEFTERSAKRQVQLQVFGNLEGQKRSLVAQVLFPPNTFEPGTTVQIRGVQSPVRERRIKNGGSGCNGEQQRSSKSAFVSTPISIEAFDAEGRPLRVRDLDAKILITLFGPRASKDEDFDDVCAGFTEADDDLWRCGPSADSNVLRPSDGGQLRAELAVDHLTSFAMLLRGSSGSSGGDCGQDELWFLAPVIATGVVCFLVVGVVLLSFFSPRFQQLVYGREGYRIFHFRRTASQTKTI